MNRLVPRRCAVRRPANFERGLASVVTVIRPRQRLPPAGQLTRTTRVPPRARTGRLSPSLTGRPFGGVVVGGLVTGAGVTVAVARTFAVALAEIWLPPTSWIATVNLKSPVAA